MRTQIFTDENGEPIYEYRTTVNIFEAVLEAFKAQGRREDYKKMLLLCGLAATTPFVFAIFKAIVSGRAAESAATQKLVAMYLSDIGGENV